MSVPIPRGGDIINVFSNISFGNSSPNYLWLFKHRSSSEIIDDEFQQISSWSGPFTSLPAEQWTNQFPVVVDEDPANLNLLFDGFNFRDVLYSAIQKSDAATTSQERNVVIFFKDTENGRSGSPVIRIYGIKDQAKVSIVHPHSYSIYESEDSSNIAAGETVGWEIMYLNYGPNPATQNITIGDNNTDALEKVFIPTMPSSAGWSNIPTATGAACSIIPKNFNLF